TSDKLTKLTVELQWAQPLGKAPAGGGARLTLVTHPRVFGSRTRWRPTSPNRWSH
ncbi:hypothetical protein BDQ94DRAFT_155887, partial [Aspergillus welwitschiae]